MPTPGPSQLTSDGGAPLVITKRNIKEQFHHLVIQTEDGDVEERKLRPTKEFFDAFNALVYELSAMCAEKALNDDRSTVMPEDVTAVRKELLGDDDEMDEMFGEED